MPKKIRVKTVAPKKTSGRGGPVKRGPGRPKGAKAIPRRIHDYADLGDAPADPLEATRWMFRGLGVSFRQVMSDPYLSDPDRRAEMRAIAGAMNRLLPKARLRQAELAVRGEDDAIQRKVDPELEPVPEVEPDEVGPGIRAEYVGPPSPPHPAPAAAAPKLEPVPERKEGTP